MVAFPTNIHYLDAATFTEKFEDVALPPAEMEGGYSITRPRFTRAPRRTFTFKFVEMRDADKAILSTFWATVRGRSNIFQWTHPVSHEVINVRFGEMSMQFSRIGFGALNLWESDTVVITEV
jgi:hypothetical protein